MDIKNKNEQKGFELSSSFLINDGLYFEPIFSIASYDKFIFDKNSTKKEDDNLVKALATKLEFQLKADLNDDSFFYFSPIYFKELNGNIFDFFGYYNNPFFENKKKLEYWMIKSGFDVKINDNFSFKTNFRTKLQEGENDYSGNLGIEYKF